MDDVSTIQAIISNATFAREHLQWFAPSTCWFGGRGYFKNTVGLFARYVSSAVSAEVDIIRFDAKRCTPQQYDTMET